MPIPNATPTSGLLSRLCHTRLGLREPSPTASMDP